MADFTNVDERSDPVERVNDDNSEEPVNGDNSEEQSAQGLVEDTGVAVSGESLEETDRKSAYKFNKKTIELSQQQRREAHLKHQKTSDPVEIVNADNSEEPVNGYNRKEQSAQGLVEDTGVAVSGESLEGTDHKSAYKFNKKTLELSQQQRREDHLKHQKTSRQQCADENRHLGCLEDFEFPDLSEEEMEVMEVAQVAQEHQKRKKRYPRLRLMMSEWFTEVPSDYPDMWLAKFCPDGHRALIIANKQKTKYFNLKQSLVAVFESNLPAGGKGEIWGQNRFTALDCIYNKKARTFFILDAIFWNGIFLGGCEVEFRFFMLKSRFSELQVKYLTEDDYKFQLLDYMIPEPSLLQDKMNQAVLADHPQILWDGVVFYHKESLYVSGETPFVLWIRTFLLPEMFGIEIHPQYLKRIPQNYQGCAEYIEKKTRWITAKREHIRKRREERKAGKNGNKPQEGELMESEQVIEGAQQVIESEKQIEGEQQMESEPQEIDSEQKKSEPQDEQNLQMDM